MQIRFDSKIPIYMQVASIIEDDIISHRLGEGETVYSQLILSHELGINPATAAKGINILVQSGILEKQRGLSMTVAEGARERLISLKRESALSEAISEVVNLAVSIGTSKEEVFDRMAEIFDKADERSEEL